MCVYVFVFCLVFCFVLFLFGFFTVPLWQQLGIHAFVFMRVVLPLRTEKMRIAAGAIHRTKDIGAGMELIKIFKSSAEVHCTNHSHAHTKSKSNGKHAANQTARYLNSALLCKPKHTAISWYCSTPRPFDVMRYSSSKQIEKTSGVAPQGCSKT